MIISSEKKHNLGFINNIRLRPGMYIGETTRKGMHLLIDEMLNNCIK